MTQVEKTTSVEEIFDGKVIKVELHEIEFEDGKSSKREIVRHNGGVTILARDYENKVLFIKQYRKAFECAMLELPAGKIEIGEKPEYTVVRELEEETGYTTDEIIKLGEVSPSPGFLTEKIHIFKAGKLVEKNAEKDWDEHLELYRFTDEEIREMVKKGEIFDAKTLCALYLEGVK